MQMIKQIMDKSLGTVHTSNLKNKIVLLIMQKTNKDSKYNLVKIQDYICYLFVIKRGKEDEKKEENIIGFIIFYNYNSSDFCKFCDINKN